MSLPDTAALLLFPARDARRDRYATFGIPAGREEAAAAELLRLLTDGLEVSLINDLDEGDEGVTTIRREGSGYQTKVGGHGWQGEWTVAGADQVRQVVVRLAPLNRGSTLQRRGSIRPQM